jgi:AraC family transcriptional regulator, L-arginine-responsive activator
MTPRIQILLLPGFSLLSLAGVTDVLAAAQQVTGQACADVRLMSLQGGMIAAAGGAAGLMTVPFDGGALSDPANDMVMVLADAPLPEDGYDAELAYLRQAAAFSLAGVGTGSWLLARAGLLDHCRATIDWPYTALFAETFPDVVATSHLFEIAPQRLTAASGTASVDMTLAWMGRRMSEGLVSEVADLLGLERVRPPGHPQRIPLAARIGGGQPKLTEAVALMEANIAEPLPTEDIARLVGVSRRQLERLFKQHLQSLPSRYYLEMRLSRARALLTQTSQSILQVGLTCGFSSGPHFSSAYRSHFGLTPREERSKRLPDPYRGQDAHEQGGAA